MVGTLHKARRLCQDKVDTLAPGGYPISSSLVGGGGRSSQRIWLFSKMKYFVLIINIFKVCFLILLKTLFSLNLSQLTSCVGASAGDLEHVPRYHEAVPEYPHQVSVLHVAKLHVYNRSRTLCKESLSLFKFLQLLTN